MAGYMSNLLKDINLLIKNLRESQPGWNQTNSFQGTS